MKNIIILLSKGRIYKEGVLFILKKKILIKTRIKSRKLFLKTNRKNIYIIIIKNIDLKKYFKNNISDCLITGKDLILEKKKNLFDKYYELNFCKCKLSILTKNIKKKKIKKIFTKYKIITKNFLKKINIKTKIEKLKSSIETYLILKITKIIIDIIASKKTIKINKIKEIKNLIKIKAIIIINRENFKKKINYFIKKFIK